MNIELIHLEEERGTKFKKSEERLKKALRFYQKSKYLNDQALEGEGKEKGQSLFKEIIAKNFPNLGKDLDVQVHEANSIPCYLSVKRPSPRHILMKLSKINHKES